MTRGPMLLAVLAVLTTAARTHAADDHLKCYRVKDPLKLAAVVDLPSAGWQSETGCRVSRAVELCVPTTKVVVEATDLGTKPPSPITPLPVAGPALDRSYACYTLKCPRTPLPLGDQIITDQFGVRTLEASSARKLCVPVVMGTTTTTTTTRPATSSCPSTTTTTRPPVCGEIGYDGLSKPGLCADAKQCAFDSATNTWQCTGPLQPCGHTSGFTCGGTCAQGTCTARQVYVGPSCPAYPGVFCGCE